MCVACSLRQPIKSKRHVILFAAKMHLRVLCAVVALVAVLSMPVVRAEDEQAAVVETASETVPAAETEAAPESATENATEEQEGLYYLCTA